ncbi:MAG: hypothetical protein AB2606_07030 [Candidatus Thiodiazotropha taylori]
MEDSGKLVESLTHIYREYDLISRRYDEFIHHIIDSFNDDHMGVVNNIQYRNTEDDGLELKFCGNEIKISYSFEPDNENKGRILLYKKVGEDFVLFDSFGYNEKAETDIQTDSVSTLYWLNEHAHAINIMLHYLKRSFNTD